MKKLLFTAVLISLLILLFSCKDKGNGSLLITANGEDFVNAGFTSVDGWQISFDSVLINLSNIKVTTADGSNLEEKGSFIVNLKAAPGESALIPVTSIESVRPANYRSIEFSMVNSDDPMMNGSSLVLNGTAIKDGESILFSIAIDEELSWNCIDGYVGDILKGNVQEGGQGEHEMTFHFDHLFGNFEEPADDHVNIGAVGFDFFLNGITDNQGTVTQQMLQETVSAEEYEKFIISLHGLGHSGEGHCESTTL